MRARTHTCVQGRLVYMLNQRRQQTSITVRNSEQANFDRNYNILTYLLPRLASYVDTLKITLNVTDKLPNQLVTQVWSHLLTRVTRWNYHSIVFEYRQFCTTPVSYAERSLEYFCEVLSQRRKLATKCHLQECILDVQHRCAAARTHTQVVCSRAAVSARIGDIFAELGEHTQLHILHVTAMTGDTSALEQSLQRLIHIRRDTLDEIYVRTSSPLQHVNIAYLMRTCAHLRSISILDHHANILDTLHECDAHKLHQLKCLFISPETPTSDDEYCKLHSALPQLMPMAESVTTLPPTRMHVCRFAYNTDNRLCRRTRLWRLSTGG